MLQTRYKIILSLLITSPLLLNIEGTFTARAAALSKATATSSAHTANSGVITGTSTYMQNGRKSTISDKMITASKTNESAIKVSNKGILSISDSKISTTGNTSSMDNSSFYGLNAAVLAESGSRISINNTSVNTTGSGANGIFATGTGAVINLTNVKINCTNTGAHGVDATKTGILNLKNVDINTYGNGASAAIATDRGGGKINATGGIINTFGTKSPGIYSTGNINVSNATVKTTNSEAATIEGKNSIKIINSSLTSGKNLGVFIYQSFSGDAEVGVGNFTMEGGTLNVKEGPAFYSTNTDAVINLKKAAIINSSNTLLKAGANQWGTRGSNGANITLNADSEKLSGNVVLDNISTAILNLKNDTIFKGTVNSSNTAKSVTVNLDKISNSKFG